MSFPVGEHCSPTDLLSRWMPRSSRAGVILSPCPDVAVPEERSPCSPFPGSNDSFSSHFAPLPTSADSSCMALEPHMELNKTESEEQEDEATAQSHDTSLVMKLEQLRQWQQHMQERLRAQQLQELLRLQQEQQRLLELMNTQDSPVNVKEPSGADWGDATLHHSPQCQVQTSATQVLEGVHTEVERPLTEHPPLLLTRPDADIEEQASVHWSEGEEQTSPSTISPHALEPQNSSTCEELSLEDRPINPQYRGQKTFEEMLEEQLRLEDQRLKSVQIPESGGGDSLACPKRVFLKRGEGLLRFTGRKAANKDSRNLSSSNSVVRSHSEPISLQQAQTCRTQKPPLQRKTATVCNDFPLTSSLRPDTKMVRLKMLQNHPRLHISHSGAAQKLSEEQASTLPAEPIALSAPRSGNIPTDNRTQAESPQAEKNQQGHSTQTAQPSAQEQGRAMDTLERSFQKRLLHWESSRQQESVELSEFELLEQAAMELSFSSNSSFVLKVLQMDQQKLLHQRRLSSTPIKSPPDPLHDQGLMQPLCMSESQSDKVPTVHSVYTFPRQSEPPYNKSTYEGSCQEESAETADSDDEDLTVTEEQPGEQAGILFDDFDTWSQLSEDHNSSTMSPDVPASPAEHHFSPKVEVEKLKAGPASSQLMVKLFPAVKTQSHNAPVNPTAAPELQTSSTQAQSQLLRERLVELEVQIERFQKENAALSKLRKDNQKLQEDLRKERCDFEQMKAQEMNRFEEYKREENKKLQRKRKLLEKHMSAARAVPNKSERQEIQTLKQQLSSLQEELRRKESRFTNTHNRLRHQLDALGQDNSSLREEVRTLEKLRLTAWKKNSTDSAPKGVKFATPLDSSSRPQSPPAPATRENRRASAPGATTDSMKGMRSSLRTPSLSGRRVESEPEDKKQSSFSEEETQRCSLSVSQHAPQTALDCGDQQQDQEDAQNVQVKVEEIVSNGLRLLVFPNGTKKEVSADGRTVKVTFFNGDTKELTADQRVIYFYAEAKTTHITYPDGTEVLHFPNNQTEKHFPDGHKEITFPDQTVKTLFPNGREESVLSDGTIIQVHTDGSKEIHFNTGQREVHTTEYKRREYPDGTVKTVYSDGRQETRYPTGRLRIKDPQGNVVVDSRT